MLQWFRARARSLTVAVLWSLATLIASSAAPHATDCHDADCIILVHDATAHAVRAGSVESGSHPLHCVVCHLARAFRAPTETTHHVAPVTHDDVRIPVDVFRPPQLFPAAQPPLRSPPSLS